MRTKDREGEDEMEDEATAAMAADLIVPSPHGPSSSRTRKMRWLRRSRQRKKKRQEEEVNGRTKRARP